jgi:RNA polymerase sigma factor (sigma-70 family)
MYRAKANECRASGCLSLFLRDIGETPLLSAQEESDLAEAISRGDTDARDRMIRANLRLVVRIARDFKGRGMTLDDLVGEGNLGLIRAVKDFDPRFQARFSTYAVYWIKQAIRNALLNKQTTIRLPVHMVKLLTKWNRAKRYLLRQRGYPPSFDELASHLGLTDQQQELVQKAQCSCRLKPHGSMQADEVDRSFDEPVDAHPGPDYRIHVQEDREVLTSRMRCLNEREKRVIRSHYGLGGESASTLETIGKQLGITREWVRIIEQRAIRKLGSLPGLDDGFPGRSQLPA